MMFPSGLDQSVATLADVLSMFHEELKVRGFEEKLLEVLLVEYERFIFRQINAGQANDNLHKGNDNG